MDRSVALSFMALSLLCAQAKDGHWNPKTSTMVTAAPSTTSTGVTPKTYYSYSYKNPAVPTPKSGTVNVADYAHKGATTIDSYKSSSAYPQISGSKWSASSTVSSAQSTATSKISSLKTSPAVNAAAQAALQSV